jgi:nucleoside-diphosphate-sugar epimerase
LSKILDRVNFFELDQSPLESVFHLFGPIDAIVHCATDYGRKSVDVAQMVEANLMLPLRLLQAGLKHGVRVFINSDTYLEKGVNEYSLSKKQLLDWLQVYSDRLSCRNMRLEHFYGPGDDPTKFVSWLIEQFRQGVAEIPLTPGRQKRDFIYIDDVVEAYRLVLEHALMGSKGYVQYDVGSGVSIELRELVERIRKLFPGVSTEPKFGAIPYRPNEVMASKIDIRPLAELGWELRTSLEDGLSKTIAWQDGLVGGDER